MLSLFNNVTDLVNELGTEKTAAAKSAMDDPGGMEGPTSHPSKKPDDDEQAPVEGFQSADNERIVKESVPDTTNKKPELTEGSAPKATDVQLGQGVDAAKPTGEDPSAEEDYKSTLEGDKKEGDQGGTSHPATGAYGEKYSADAFAEMDDAALCKSSKDLGDDVLADIANGLWADDPATPAAPDANAAAQAGEKIAADAGQVDDQLEQVASGVVQNIVKAAYHQADLTAAQIFYEMEKQSEHPLEGEGEDPTGGAAEGEDHGSDPTREPPVEGEEAPPEEEGAEGLLAAMGGGGPEEALGGEEGLLPGAGPEMGGEMGGEMGPEMGGAMGPEMGGEMGGLGGEMGGEMGGGMGGPPPEMAGMPDEAVIQQLAMALMEAGIDPQMLAAAASPEATKIAAAVLDHKKSGNFCFEEAKQGSDKRTVRDYMKGFVTELYRRSQK
jgi:hypothetical protein